MISGTIHIEAFKDKDGEWLEGAKQYKLHVPADVPSIRFWSVTVYDNKTRSMTMNKENEPALTSYDFLTKAGNYPILRKLNIKIRALTFKHS